MIMPGAELKLYVARRPVDFRHGLDRLEATAREVFGLVSYAGAAIAFISQAAFDDRIDDKLHLQRRLVAVKGARGVRKKDMIHNTLAPKIEVDPQNYEIRVDGELIIRESAASLPMAQRHFLF